MSVSEPAPSDDALPEHLPSDWSTATISESCEKPEYGHTASAERTPVGPRFLRITDIQGGRVDWRRVPYCRCEAGAVRRLGLRRGDLLIARIGGTTGKSFFVGECPEAVFASYLIRLRAKAVDPAFLYFFCQSKMYWRQVLASKGEKLKGGVSASTLGQIIHPVPPPDEQRAIAGVLSKLQTAVELQDRIVATLSELKSATMAKLFREGLRGEPLKQTEIGEIPESWKLVPLERLAEVHDRRRIPLNEEQRRSRRGPYPYCGANGVVDHIDTFLFDGEFVLVAEDGGYWGSMEPTSYLMSGRFWVNNHAHVLTAIEGRSVNSYLSPALNFLNLNPLIGGDSRGKLTQALLRAIQLPVPAVLDEQVDIGQTFQIVDQRLANAEKSRAALHWVFEGTLRSTMTGELRLPSNLTVDMG